LEAAGAPGDAEKELACNTISARFVILAMAAPCCRYRSRKMGRRSVFDMLHTARRAQALAIVQANRHASLSELKAILADEMGLKISRSAIHRNLRKTDASGQTMARPDESTVVTIVGRSTGEVRIVKTTLAGAVVEELIRQSVPAAEFHPL